ncbi:MAG: lysylphosphatidylglycerol synthase domain-containing protein, partial [Caldilineales bacterium]|nr:lysylphosphatidylglycerol synthase domain-containing protein [Caldilineales bacterium]
YVTLVGLGQEPGRLVLEVAVFTLAAATLIGAVSFLPGGLGAADLSLTGLLTRLLSLNPGEAVAATLIIRFFTLWFGVAIGMVAMMVVLRRLHIDRDRALESADEAYEYA